MSCLPFLALFSAMLFSSSTPCINCREAQPRPQGRLTRKTLGTRLASIETESQATQAKVTPTSITCRHFEYEECHVARQFAWRIDCYDHFNALWQVMIIIISFGRSCCGTLVTSPKRTCHIIHLCQCFLLRVGCLLWWFSDSFVS